MHLAFFHAPWCGVCHEKAPLVDALARDARLDLQKFDIETDDGREEAELRRIRQVPTLALVHGERVPFRLIGAMITQENVAHLLAIHAPGAAEGA